MKKLLFGAIFLALVISLPVPTTAQVSIHIGIPLPPPIVFSRPPEVVLLPHTGVYVAPDLAVDLFFFDGWWWRSWEGRWYRSQNYRSGWGYYNGVPSFHGRVPSGWRDDYRAHRWNGHEFHYQRLSHPELQQIWQRKLRKQSQPQQRVSPQQSRPQRYQADRPQSQGRTLQRDIGRSQQSRPQQPPRSGPQESRSPHGKPEGRR
jgi:hypothetical protein